MKKILFFPALLLCLCGLAANFDGPFRLEGGAFYFVHDGGPLKLSLTFTSDYKNPLCPFQNKQCGGINVRFMDVNENQVFFTYEKLPQAATKEISHDFGADAPKGIYQVRFAASPAIVAPKAIPEKPFGILPGRCKVHGAKAKQFSDFYFYIPENANTLRVATYGGVAVALADDAGNKIALTKEPMDLKPHKGKIWHGSAAKMRNDYFANFGFTGTDIILCPDPETAKAIHGSVDLAKDGKFYPHKYQLAIVDYIEALRKENLQMELPSLRQFIPEMEKDPAAKGLVGLWGLFPHANGAIAEQNLDPASPDFGKATYTGIMGAMLALNKPYNPYYKHPVLEKRLLLGGLRELLRLQENSTFYASDSNYCGADGLIFIGNVRPCHFASSCISDRQALTLWTTALAMQAERWAFTRVSCDNQSSHWLIILQCLFDITGNKLYADMAANYAYGMSAEGGDPFMKTGYQQEAYGADGTYQGLGACYQALYFRMSRNPVQKENLRVIYNFYNHSCAPEPDGKVFACSSYGHRTKGGWTHRQYFGGIPLMQGELPEAAVWCRNKPAEKTKTIRQLFHSEIKPNAGNGAKYATAPFSSYVDCFLYPSTPLKGATFPMETGGTFKKNFNKEFAAIRTATCYTFTYLKGNAGKWIVPRFARTFAPQPSSGTWATIPGLQLLWFQDFGNVMVATNYNGDTAHALMADLGDNKCAYTSYWDNKSTMDEDGTIRMANELLHLPEVKVNRILTQQDNGITMKMTVTFKKEITVKDLFEQLPLLDYKRKVELLVNGAWTTEPGKTDTIRINEKVTIKLSRPLACSFAPKQENQGVPIRALRIHLGNRFTAKDTLELTYTITK